MDGMFSHLITGADMPLIMSRHWSHPLISSLASQSLQASCIHFDCHHSLSLTFEHCRSCEGHRRHNSIRRDYSRCSIRQREMDERERGGEGSKGSALQQYRQHVTSNTQIIWKTTGIRVCLCWGIILQNWKETCCIWKDYRLCLFMSIIVPTTPTALTPPPHGKEILYSPYERRWSPCFLSVFDLSHSSSHNFLISTLCHTRTHDFPSCLAENKKTLGIPKLFERPQEYSGRW